MLPQRWDQQKGAVRAQQSFLLGGDLTPLTGFKSRAAVAMQKARGEMDVQGCFRNDTENHR